jgi:hypothetical protein
MRDQTHAPALALGEIAFRARATRDGFVSIGLGGWRAVVSG